MSKKNKIEKNQNIKNFDTVVPFLSFNTVKGHLIGKQ